MTSEYHEGSVGQVNRGAILARRCLQLALVLLVIGLVPALLAIWGERRAMAHASWRDPADSIQSQAIALDLALLSLAGVPDDQVLTLSIEVGELATVHAMLAFSADLTDQQRINGWLWLGHRFQRAEQTQRAAQAYRLSGSGAVLSQELPDLLRTETLLAVGQQLVLLHDKTSARLFLTQAACIGANTTQLTAYHRRSLLERLIPASLRAGGKRDDWIALAKAVKNDEAGRISANGLVPTGTASWREVAPARDAALAAAQGARRAAAAAWVGALSAQYETAESVQQGFGESTSETEADTSNDEAAQALRQALLAEDVALEQFASGKQDLAVQETRLRWLFLKRRIAAGGAGAGLVPEWESSREEIDAAVTAAWSDWLALQTSSKGANPSDGFLGLPARAGRWAISAAYWGLYPDAPVADLVAAVEVTSRFGRLRLTIVNPGSPPVVGWSD